jgi:hypothetical protein
MARALLRHFSVEGALDRMCGADTHATRGHERIAAAGSGISKVDVNKEK